MICIKRWHKICHLTSNLSLHSTLRKSSVQLRTNSFALQRITYVLTIALGWEIREAFYLFHRFISSLVLIFWVQITSLNIIAICKIFQQRLLEILRCSIKERVTDASTDHGAWLKGLQTIGRQNVWATTAIGRLDVRRRESGQQKWIIVTPATATEARVISMIISSNFQLRDAHQLG